MYLYQGPIGSSNVSHIARRDRSHKSVCGCARSRCDNRGWLGLAAKAVGTKAPQLPLEVGCLDILLPMYSLLAKTETEIRLSFARGYTLVALS